MGYTSSTNSDLKVDEAKVHDEEKILFTESAFLSKTFTRAKFKSSLFPNPSFAKDVKAEVERRDRFRPVHLVEVRVSRSCFDNSVL